MIIFLLCLIVFAVLLLLLWIGFTITGGLLLTGFWLFIKVPLALILFFLAVIFCLTIILIPLGIVLFKVGLRLLIPGV